MQLLILLLLLTGVDCSRLNEVKPLIKSIGGEEEEKVIVEAEKTMARAQDISAMISAVQTMTASSGAPSDKNNSPRPDKAASTRANNNSARHNEASAFASNSWRREGKPCTPDNPCRAIRATYPLAPIATIADETIACALAKYIAMGD